MAFEIGEAGTNGFNCLTIFSDRKICLKTDVVVHWNPSHSHGHLWDCIQWNVWILLRYALHLNLNWLVRISTHITLNSSHRVIRPRWFREIMQFLRLQMCALVRVNNRKWFHQWTTTLGFNYCPFLTNAKMLKRSKIAAIALHRSREHNWTVLAKSTPTTHAVFTHQSHCDWCNRFAPVQKHFHHPKIGKTFD